MSNLCCKNLINAVGDIYGSDNKITNSIDNIVKHYRRISELLEASGSEVASSYRKTIDALERASNSVDTFLNRYAEIIDSYSRESIMNEEIAVSEINNYLNAINHIFSSNDHHSG